MKLRALPAYISFVLVVAAAAGCPGPQGPSPIVPPTVAPGRGGPAADSGRAESPSTLPPDAGPPASAAAAGSRPGDLSVETVAESLVGRGGAARRHDRGGGRRERSRGKKASGGSTAARPADTKAEKPRRSAQRAKAPSGPPRTFGSLAGVSGGGSAAAPPPPPTEGSPAPVAATPIRATPAVTTRSTAAPTAAAAAAPASQAASSSRGAAGRGRRGRGGVGRSTEEARGQAAAFDPGPRRELGERASTETALPSDASDRAASVAPAPPKAQPQTIYLSNDDSMSLSSAQRVELAVRRFLPIPMQHLRPHEFLNYFSFQTAPVAPKRTFSIRGDLVPGDDPGTWTLALAVAGRSVDRRTRSRATLTLVVDVSGSMRAEGKMNFLRRGLRRMVEELRPGDLVNVVEFDDRAFVSLENYVVGRDAPALLDTTIADLRPRGGTNLHAGLTAGYGLARRYALAGSRNKVILITDAMANVGRTSPGLLAEIGKQLDEAQIELSGVGVGEQFNDRLLDRLTERGRGAYLFLGSEQATDRVFGRDFVSLLETVARDVRFKLVLPPSLRMKTYYGEEASTVREDVKAIHYFAGTTQLFLSDLEQARPLDDREAVVLEVEFKDVVSGAARRERFELPLGDLQRSPGPNPAKGKALMALTDLLGALGPVAPRRVPLTAGRVRAGWRPPASAVALAPRCAAGLQAVERKLARADPADPELQRIRELGASFCRRFGPVQPVARVNHFAPPGRGGVAR